jgi:two-component system cell cycle sensor histidine kinase/response regulator CckA
VTPPHNPPHDPPDTKQTILLVEDEVHVRNLLVEFLTLSGYTVLSAGDAPQALNIIADASQRIDLLLTDIVLPGMCGWELAERFADARPASAILAMSGLRESAMRPAEGARKRPELLQKPFSLPTLAAAVRRTLEGRTGE